jgi:hypothetical protein
MDKKKRCEVCGSPIEKIHANRANRYCSQRCYVESGSRTKRKRDKVKGQRMRTAKGHPIAPPSGVVAVSRLALYDKIGGGSHPCHWCNEPVEWKGGLVPGALIVDHLNWDRQDDRPENLVPSCNMCNAHRTQNRRHPLIQEGELTLLVNGRHTRAVMRTCETCETEFPALPAFVRAGKARYCSKACMWGRSKTPPS